VKLYWICLALALPVPAADLRLGIIGTDTSHATAFARALNDYGSPEHISGARIVAAYKGGSPEIEESARRVDRFAAELRDKWGVKFVASIGELCPLTDGLLLESIDGRSHLAQFRQAITCGKPVFIDKPLAATLADVYQIAHLARESQIPWFSSSTLRFSEIANMRNVEALGAMVWSPGPTEPHHSLDLAWYGIHGVEMLYTLMGTGCVEVTRVSSPDSDVVTGRWKNGSLGTLHTQRPYGKYGAVVFLKDQKLEAEPDIPVGYLPLVKEIVEFMQTRKPPVPNSETLEMFEFMAAAQRSLEEGGKPIKLTGNH
jgi:Oxidoreductase family, NAD-binding Rossmann fold